MSEQNMFDILKKMLDKTNITELSEKLVLTTESGYELFGKYVITHVNNQYIVSAHKRHLSQSFYTLKNAVIWTTLYANNKISDSKRILDLDVALEGANFEIKLHDTLAKKAKSLEAKSIHATKVVENKHRKYLINRELAEYEERVKKWQYTQFSKITA
jgi:hypothetical protein